MQACELHAAHTFAFLISSCLVQMIMRYKHVNIYDLIEADQLGTPVKVFDTVEELAIYTRQEGLTFPRNNAVAGGFLRYFLRRIYN